jgi:hypothetical protein
VGLGHLAVWSAAVVLAAPLAAQQTYNWDCGDYYCGSAAYWDAGSNTINGDSFTWDWYDDGNWVYVGAVMESPDGHWLDSGGLEPFGTYPIFPGSDTEDAYAEVEATLWDPGPGTWDTDGDHQYGVWSDDEDEWVFTDMGDDFAYDNATNSDVPTSETTSLNAPAPSDEYGEEFKVALVPDSAWSGLLDEQLDSNDDSCYDTYGLLGGPLPVQPGGGWLSSQHTFYDMIAQISYYVTTYSTKIRNSDGPGCGEQSYIWDSFNGATYYGRGSGVWLSGSQVQANRDGVDGPWQNVD